MEMTTETAAIIRQKDARIADLERQVDNLRSTSEKQSVIIEENPKQLFLDFEDAQQIPFEDKKPAAESKTKEKGSELKKKPKKKGGNQLVLTDNLEVEKLFLMSRKMKSLIQ